MSRYSVTLSVTTNKKRQIIDITDQLNEQLRGDGWLLVFLKHTTAAVIIADLDPGTDLDILDALELMTPQRQWRHPHDPSHFPDHLWSAILGPSQLLPYTDSQLDLGTWQRVVLLELDGPRQRTIEYQTIAK